MKRASITKKAALICLILTTLILLSSCNSLFVDDGDVNQGISPQGGYFYTLDNEAYAVRMLDANLRLVKSWSLSGLASDTRFQGLTHDGEYLWLSVAGSADMLYQVNATGDSLVVVRSFDAPPAGSGTVRDISWDGTHLWALNSGSETYATPATLYKLDPVDGSIVEEYVLPSAEPRALAWVGDNANAYGSGAARGIYIADVDLDSVYCFRTDKMLFSGAFVSPTPPRGESYIFPVGLCFDGVAFWLINSSSAGDHLYRLDDNGAELERIEFPYATPGPVVWAAADIRVAGPPTLEGVSPNAGSRGATMTVTVTGSGFVPGPQLNAAFGAGIAVNQVVFVDGNTLEVDIEIAADAEFGERDVTVTNPDGKSVVAESLFVVLSIDPLAGYLWLLDSNADSLFKIRIIDTTIVQSWSVTDVAPGGSPQGLAFDGTSLWLSAGGSDDQVLELNTSGATLSAVTSHVAPPDAEGIVRDMAFDGEHLWVANSGTSHIYQLDRSSGAILDSIPTPSGEARGIAYADGSLYCNDRSIDSVFVYDFGAEAWTAVFASPTPPGGTTSNRYGTGMSWDGVNFWLVNSTYAYDYLFQVSVDGTVLRTYEVPNRGDATPTGLAFTQD